MTLRINQVIEYDGRSWEVVQIQPDHQLALLRHPADYAQMQWVREVHGDLIPYDITKGRPRVQLPESAQRALDRMVKQRYGHRQPYWADRYYS